MDTKAGRARMLPTRIEFVGFSVLCIKNSEFIEAKGSKGAFL
jgi:hypothetical protein